MEINMTEYTYDSWKKDLLTKHILVHFCPQCGLELHTIDNLYFPDHDTYICNNCEIAFTLIVPGELLITHKLTWDPITNKFIKSNK